VYLEGLRALIDSAAKATKLEHPRVAIFGECVALLHGAGKHNATIRIEQTGNDLLKAQRTPFLDIMCAYPLPPFSKDLDPAFKSICTEHSAVSLR
jgi:hypothetical protein